MVSYPIRKKRSFMICLGKGNGDEIIVFLSVLDCNTNNLDGIITFVCLRRHSLRKCDNTVDNVRQNVLVASSIPIYD